MKLSDEIVHFLSKQGVVLISSLDAHGRIHSVAKGIVGVLPEGRVFIIDLHLNRTFHNLVKNPTVSISALDEKNFKGYTLQGRAKIVPRDDIAEHIIEAWEKRIIERISKRVIWGVQSGIKSAEHFEAALPWHPKYLIEVDVENVADFAAPIKMTDEEK